MKIIAMTLAVVAGLSAATTPKAFGQVAAAGSQITGRVTDTTGNPVTQVDVRLLELKRATITDADGRYVFSQLPSGTYTVNFSILGYAPVTRRMTVTRGENPLSVALRASPIEVPSIQVTASATPTNALDSPQPTTVLADEDLEAVQAPSLGETLERVPGVHNLSTGVGIGKPVIRGLTSNRVLVLDDGQRLETQQWGDEHGPNIETATANRIEVIRGPASVLYGSDALGGVINVISPDVPDALDRDPFVSGSFTGRYASNNQQPEGDFSLEGASGGLGFRVAGTGRRSDNLHTPDYELWNSGNRSVGGSGALGYHGSWGSVNGRYVYRDERIELTDEDPAETPFQRIGDHRAEFELTAPLGGSRLEASVGFEHNRRREFEEEGATDVALGLTSRTYTTELHLHHPTVGPLYGLVGLSGLHTSFQKFGEETLIPENTANGIGAYLFEQADAGPWSFSMGARYDHRSLDVKNDSELDLAPQKRSWNSFTGNVGLLYRVVEPMALVLNVGRGFRAPSAFELYSNGVHEGTLAFERGDPDLDTEKSLNFDLAARVLTGRVIGELGGFVNRIQDFIFTQPTTEVDPESGFQIFDVVQGDALLSGLESSIEFHPSDAVHLQGTVDYVHGENTSRDEPLPNIPPLRATYEARWEGPSGDLVQNPILWIGGESNARQTRLNPSDAEFFDQVFEGEGFRSASYTLINAGGGLALQMGSGRLTRFDLQIRNLFDESYAPFLSRIKTNAMNPGQGRNLVLRLTTEF